MGRKGAGGTGLETLTSDLTVKPGPGLLPIGCETEDKIMILYGLVADSCTHELSAVVTACTRPAQAHAR